jgi:transposase
MQERIAELEAYRYKGIPCYEVRALYTRPSRPLTDEQITAVWEECISKAQVTALEFARALERAQGIKAGSSATATEHPQGSA